MKTRLLFAVLLVGVLIGGRFAAAQSAEPTFDELDKNHDGVLSKDEVAAMFPAVNDSGSGGAQRHSGNGPGGGGGGGFGAGGGFGGGGGFGAGGGGFGHGGHGGGTMHSPGTGGDTTRSSKPPNIDDIFKSWDKNGDGKISREEFDARPHSKSGGRRHGASSADDQRAPPSL
jgi:hypothetical protein